MTKKEKEELKEKINEIRESLLIVVENLDGCCGKQGFCEDCPINIDEYTCCLSTSQVIYNNLTTLLKEKKK